MNILTEATELELEAIPHMLKHIGKFKPTVPYHKLKQCEDRHECVWHRRTK